MEQINVAITIRPTFDNLHQYPERCLLQPSWSQTQFHTQSSDVPPSNLFNIHRCYTLHSRCQLDLLLLWLHQRCCNVFEVCSVYANTFTIRWFSNVQSSGKHGLWKKLILILILMH